MGCRRGDVGEGVGGSSRSALAAAAPATSPSAVGAADKMFLPPPKPVRTRNVEYDLVAVVAPPCDRGFETAIEVLLRLPAEQFSGA